MAFMGLIGDDRKNDEAPGVRAAVGVFALAGAIAMLVVAVGGTFALRETGRQEAVRDAERLAGVLARTAIGPAIEPAVLQGDAAALARLDTVVRERVLDESIARVKIWTGDGRVIYSDERRLIGSQFGLGAAEEKSLQNGVADARPTDLSKPENQFEADEEGVVEVYVPAAAPDGTPLLIEAYVRESAVAASGARIVRSFAPPLLLALAGLWLVQLPLAWSLVRRLRRRQAERERLLRHAVESSTRERRRIAADLHDGVVQELAGASLALSAEARRRAASDHEAAALLGAAAEETRRGVRALRALLVDIYPPALHERGLVAALGDLVQPLEERGIATSLDLDPELRLPRTAEATLFRAAQEAVRNAAEHGRPERISVAAGRRGSFAFVEVADDGRGFDTAAPGPEGHFGLRLLDDLVDEAGGALRIESAPGRGTRVAVEVPA